MAHEHLHFKDDIAVEHTHGKQVRVSLALLGTLAGGTLLLSHYVSKWFVYGPNAFQTEILAFAGAILLGSPIIWHAIKSLAHKEAHMDELVALAILAAIATRQYPAACVVAFFMLLSELVESRTALVQEHRLNRLLNSPLERQINCIPTAPKPKLWSARLSRAILFG